LATSQEEWSILWTTLPGEIEGGKTFLYHHINTNATNAHLVHPTQADYFRIKQWIRTCNEEHESCNEQGSDSAASLFGHSEFSLHVIDVELRRIVQCQHPVRYVALSYMWGASKLDPPEPDTPGNGHPVKSNAKKSTLLFNPL